VGGFLKANVDFTLTEKQRRDRLRTEMRKMFKDFPLPSRAEFPAMDGRIHLASGRWQLGPGMVIR
jgi:hypothetical protein